MAALALLAQCWIAASPLGEARGIGASSHVEAQGTQAHFAHDEADCAACRTLALHAILLPASRAFAAPAVDSWHALTAALAAPQRAALHLTRPRAPPSVA